MQSHGDKARLRRVAFLFFLTYSPGWRWHPLSSNRMKLACPCHQCTMVNQVSFLLLAGPSVLAVAHRVFGQNADDRCCPSLGAHPLGQVCATDADCAGLSCHGHWCNWCGGCVEGFGKPLPTPPPTPAPTPPTSAPTPVPTPRGCVAKRTTPSDDGDNNVHYLDRHNVDCGGNGTVALSGMALHHPESSQFSYDYMYVLRK